MRIESAMQFMTSCLLSTVSARRVLRYVARSVCEFDGRWIYPDLVPYTNIYI